jgi:hypothetical protein
MVAAIDEGVARLLARHLIRTHADILSALTGGGNGTPARPRSTARRRHGRRPVAVPVGRPTRWPRRLETAVVQRHKLNRRLQVAEANAAAVTML